MYQALKLNLASTNKPLRMTYAIKAGNFKFHIAKFKVNKQRIKCRQKRANPTLVVLEKIYCFDKINLNKI